MPLEDGPLVDRPTRLLRGVRIVPAGVVAARPGVPVFLALDGWSHSREVETGARLDVRWTVSDEDGRPVAAGGAFSAPRGLDGPETTLVFPTQLRRSASHVPYTVEATVELTAAAGPNDRAPTPPPARLLPVRVHVAALGAAGARALLTHVASEFAAAGAGGAGLGVPMPPPPLELLGLPPVPVTLIVTGRAAASGPPTIRLSAHLPVLGRVTSGPIPLPEPSPSPSGRRWA